jgi:kinesin family member 2/24
MMGDTFTGMNVPTANRTVDTANLGLYYMAALDLFHAIRAPGYEMFSIRVSLFEIYGGKLFDLLNGRAAVKCLEDRKGNVCFPGLSEHPVVGSDALMNLITAGSALRSTGTTSRNADSSRSHAVLQLHVYKPLPVRAQKLPLHQRGRASNRHRSTSSAATADSEWSRLTFIDLAGSERGADTAHADRATRLEGAEINTSLLALKEVIRALATGDSLSHVPFRGSKLTQVLKQSFVGKNCRSVMIACISPNMGSCEQTLNTLRYADRVKERNAETGQVARVANKMASPKRDSSVESASLTRAAGSVPDFSANISQSSAHSEMLDDLLASPASGASGNESDFLDVYVDNLDRQQHEVSETLLGTHQDVRSYMLEMLKEEMNLVNNVDTNGQLLEDYVSEVYSLQDDQLSMITMLREQLIQFRFVAAQQAQIGRGDFPGGGGGGGGTFLSDGEDSFEDLRH